MFHKNAPPKARHFWRCILFLVFCFSYTFGMKSNKELHCAERRVDGKQGHALPAAEFAADHGGDGEQQHDAEHDGNVENEGRVHAADELAGGHRKG